jgi:hypothetical protein
MDARRETLIGWSDPNDRLWILGTPDFEAAITDYNWELTGYDKRLHELDPEVFHYSGNVYYITGAYARSRGWTTTRVEDRLT